LVGTSENGFPEADTDCTLEASEEELLFSSALDTKSQRFIQLLKTQARCCLWGLCCYLGHAQITTVKEAG